MGVEEEDIDDSLYSRQRCVLGEGAMRKISRSKIFLSGLGGVGVEIAKNLVLGGVEELIIQDNSICTPLDLGTQFFVRKKDIDARKTRAEATLPHLVALNPYVRITVESRDLKRLQVSSSDECNSELLRAIWSEDQPEDQRVKCLIITDCQLNTAATLDLFCRKHDICFIYTDVYGVFGNLFCDFGPKFLVLDPDGEPPAEFFIGHMEKLGPSELLIKVYGDRRHQLQSGNAVQFREIKGMPELKDGVFLIRVTSPYEFVVDVDTESLPVYNGGGIVTQVILPLAQSFEPMVQQLRRPSIELTDLSHPDEGLMLHLTFLALAKFRQEMSRFPEPWDEKDWHIFRQGLNVLLELFPDEVTTLDEELIKRLALVSKGQLAPLCAFFGGVAAQEAMKAVSGSFTPVKQWLYMQCESVVPKEGTEKGPLQLHNSRYDPLTICVGADCLRGLHTLSAFLVGCGAIGCELLKNLALLGLATADSTPGPPTEPTCSIPASCCVPPLSSSASACPMNIRDSASKPPVMSSLDQTGCTEHVRSGSTTCTGEDALTASGPVAIGDVATDELVRFTSSAPTTSVTVSDTSVRSPIDHGKLDSGSSLRSIDPQSMTAESISTSQTDSSSDKTIERTVTGGSNDCCTPKVKVPRSSADKALDSEHTLTPEHVTQLPTLSLSASSAQGTTNQSVSATSAGADVHAQCPVLEPAPRAVNRPDPLAESVASEARIPRLVITDPDHIEKSNLNRQFLFRPEHIGQSKSRVAAQAIRAINPQIMVHAMEHKVSQFNEKTVFTDKFLLDATGSDPLNVDARTRHTGVVLAALDCVPSRRYLDSRCVSLQLPLFESGTLGTKGHVQVVLPGLTESYNSQRDDDTGTNTGTPGAESIPYCTLKSFPNTPVHCIEWAKEKFASQFTLKPEKLSQLLGAASGSKRPELLVRLASELLGISADANPRPDESRSQPTDEAEHRLQTNWLRNHLSLSLARFLASRPTDWSGCVRLARDKFERYFKNKARRLLHAFPPDKKLPDGTPFWQLPKRQPTPIQFCLSDALHRLFVVSYARLLADQLHIAIPEPASGPIDQVPVDHLEQCLLSHKPPAFVPSNKRIVVDETESAPASDELPRPSDSDEGPIADAGDSAQSSMLDEYTIHSLQLLLSTLQDAHRLRTVCACHSVKFEKDDDSLAHVDFITAAANLRATMYGLPVTARYEVRRIAGRIVPAIATTTAAVAGLVSLELVKLVASQVRPRRCVAGAEAEDANTGSGPLPRDTLNARNAFLNLALPAIILSEPGPCVRHRLPNGTEFTLWDRWVLPAPVNWETYRLVDFIADFKHRYGLQPAVITQMNRMIYVSYLPMHKARLNKILKDLLAYEAHDQHIDLMLAYDPGPDQPSDADYIQGPPVRLLLPAHAASTLEPVV